MISVTVADSATPWRYAYKGISQGFAGLHAQGYAIGQTSKGPELRTTILRDTGLIQQTGSYGDSSQECHGVIHRDVEGSVFPNGMAENSGHLCLATADPNAVIIYESGDYDFVTPFPAPSPYDSKNYCESHHYYKLYRSDKGFACLSAGGSFMIYSGSKGEYLGINSLSWNYASYNFDGKTWRRYKSGSKRVQLYRDDPELSKVVFELEGSTLLLDIWPNGSSSGRDARLTFNNVFTPKVYSPPLSKLYRGARTLSELIPRYHLPDDMQKQLYSECVEGQNCFTSNGIAYASDIGKIGDSIRALLALVADPTSPKQWASAWLSMRFSDRLTYQDSKELLGAIRGQLSRLMVGMSYKETHSSCSYSYMPNLSHLVKSFSIRGNARLRCDNESYNGLMTAVKKLMEWDVWPSLENTWDMIPLSFVADWFSNLSTILANVDRLVYEQYLRVRIYERSDKIRVEFTDESIAHAFGTSPDFLIGNVTGKYYTRWSAERPQLGILDGWDPSLPAPKNYVDSAALLVQMR
jgi:hypothetical protein